MSQFASQTVFAEAANWDLCDVNVRVGPSGVHGELALDAPALLDEMDRYFIRSAVVSHWTGEEYEPAVGNERLAQTIEPRLVAAWTAVPEHAFVEQLATRLPKAVRLTPGVRNHNFAVTTWGAGELLEYLQALKVVTLIAREDLPWDTLIALLENFPRLPLVLLDIGYRVDNYLFPLLKRFPTLHFDSATYLSHRQFEAFIDSFGSERILFGSRLPLFTPAASLGVLASARIPDSARLAVAGGNLRRLLSQAQSGSQT